MGEITRLKRTALAIATVVGAAMLGCAGAASAPKDGPLPLQSAPLASMAGRPVLVFPIQLQVINSDLHIVSDAPKPPPVDFLGAFDDSIAAALGERGLSNWTFASGITASAKRNAGMTADPHVLAVGKLQRLVKAGDDPLGQPLATQIRSLVALRDARYVILPSIIRFENREGGVRGSLLLYLIDTRTSRITWSGEMISDVSSRFPAIAGSLAQRIADLVVAR
ncbi:MAG: hypothetical protein ABI875_01910 [Gemmatimonadales bacterium]